MFSMYSMPWPCSEVHGWKLTSHESESTVRSWRPEFAVATSLDSWVALLDAATKQRLVKT
jgi:hypothetical protein